MTRLSHLLKTSNACLLSAIVLTLVVGSLGFPMSAACQSVTGQEYNVKIGFIYNFINFVSWPDGVFDDPSQPITLCLISNEAPSEVLYKLDGKSVKGRRIQVVPYNGGLCLPQSHVLFFATQDVTLIQKVLGLAHGLGILSIGEVEGFIRLGGVINFFQESNRLRFKINVEAAKREGLKMSSQLLRSAKIVGKMGE
jgi:hypothetical protein